MPFHIHQLLCLCILLIGYHSLYSQESGLKGIVRDSLHNPVPYTNIIATPLSNDAKITFAIADDEGRYKLVLKNSTEYKLQLTHLGYSKRIDTLSISKDTNFDFTLYKSSERLEEVTIETEMALIVKKDTLIYRTDHFTTGEEGKLRELLDNLPGVEVDREGNVTVNGKRVNKLLVEGKPFFTGDTKMGVNNIPADAVEEVVALDNYHEIAFLKEFSNSDQLALNIKLKEGKKKFVFGEVEAGGGVKERYLANPTLFYYSERTAVNVIGDFNNTGERSFTLRDYINFEGGMAGMLRGSSSFSNIFNSDFAHFLNQSNFTHSKNEFLAGSVSHQLTKATTLDAYTILSKGNVETLEHYDVKYLTGSGLEENRKTTSDDEVGFTLNKVKLRIQPESDTDVAYDALFKTSSGDGVSNISSTTDQKTFNTRTLSVPENLSLVQDVRFHKKFSYKHTSTFTLQHKYNNSDNSRNWLFDRKPFSQLIPFINEGEEYNLIQHTNAKGNDFNVKVKHYWVLNQLNHIYPEVGLNYLGQDFFSLDYQRLQDGTHHSFVGSGFDNALKFQLLDFYAGFEYKFKKGNFTFKPGLVYHNYQWSANQFDEELVSQTEDVVLPSLEVEWELGPSEEMELNYNLESDFSNASQYANRLRLSGYNQLYRGNSELKNELSHSASLRYRKFNLYRGINMNANLYWSRKTKSVQNSTLLEGIDRITSLLYTDRPETNIGFRGAVSKRLGKLRLSITGNISAAEYTREVNGEFLSYKSKNYTYEVKGKTRFNKGPNFEMGVAQSFRDFHSKISENKFAELNPFGYLEYGFWDDFIFKADYTYNFYTNKTRREENDFHMANASLYYNRENSPWGFEIETRNLFDIRYKNANSLSQFILTDQKIYVQPRMVLLKVMYKI